MQLEVRLCSTCSESRDRTVQILNKKKGVYNLVTRRRVTNPSGRPGPPASGKPGSSVMQPQYTAQQRKVRKVRQALSSSSTSKAQAKKLASSLGGNTNRILKTAQKRGALKSSVAMRKRPRG